ncbi:glycosyl transferase, family 25 [Aliivibrio fischeri MJ11]|uniref:Glycosyl transferase, family 25 n=1 Tax=Aliivibrio fischeri (strain MJ11) TaxID=388396 RepID=B5FFS8_ALIFM|nr:glycosyl transferase, family 25 [Aliivibrio fischeri MJ11]
MKVFVVSLKRSVDRRERIQKHLDALDISFEFFDAIDGSIEHFQYSDHARPVTTKNVKATHLKQVKSPVLQATMRCGKNVFL